ncbi:T9SS type A sorting domain-containing protein [Hymenobacter sp. BT175]|uniref:T9SS type A sorting domain-containing protein n=1 Tax=Hymenobacter translucens TaxID=2886507 RepID=UPI001D0E9D5A|nr:T9SS type A sorting domain-containing protein [Hymenobacter translucens]MCC2548004.1 T9SS type A sorting domain-containing protein [Hymenobacter translucens]
MPASYAQQGRIVAGQTAGLRVMPSTINFGCSPAGFCQELDVDGDGQNDLILSTRTVGTGSGSGVYYIEAEAKRADTEVAGADSATWGTTVRNRGMALPLAAGDSISSRPRSSGRYVWWKPASGTLMSKASLYFSQVSPSGSSTSGYWRDTATHYLGLRMAQRGGGYRYGWLRIKGQATVRSYAFQTSINPVRPGQLAGLAIYPNPANGQLFVQLPTPGSARVEILDARGACRREQLILTGSAPAELLLTGLAPGLYLVRVSTAAGSFTQRIIRQ